MKAISVIIPVLADPAGLELTLRTLLPSAEEGDEFLVANDTADPGVSAVKDKFPHHKIRIIDITESKGSYHARNQAINAASNELFLFADAGLEFPANTLTIIRKTLEDYDYVAGNVKVRQKQNEHLSESYYRMTAFDMKDMFERYHAGGAGFLAVRKAVLNKCGYFDERLYSGADNEFGMRVFMHGFKQYFAEDLIAYHKSRNWKQQFRVALRINKGRKELARLYPDHYKEMDLNALTLIRFPISAIRSIAGNLKQRKKAEAISAASMFYASSVHHVLNFTAMLLILIFPKKNFNLR